MSPDNPRHGPHRGGILGAGTPAPDFTLHSTPDQNVSLQEFRGAPLILAFYPADWSPVCGDQMALYNEVLPEFKRFGAAILGISVDGIWCHLAFARDRKLRFPLLADFEPKGSVAQAYGAYRATEGVSERALFVLDGEGIIRWSHLSPVGINPGADGILDALEEYVRTGWRTHERHGALMSALLKLPVGSRDHVAGATNAAVVLVEYGDYECPHCGAAHLVLKELMDVVSDRVSLVFRNFPLSAAHSRAMSAAEAAEAAGAQGRFWPMHDMLFENQDALEDEDLLRYAKALDLDVARFGRELASGVHVARVREDFSSGVRSGVNGTPTFFINGHRHDESYELDALLPAIEEPLALTSPSGRAARR